MTIRVGKERPIRRVSLDQPQQIERVEGVREGTLFKKNSWGIFRICYCKLAKTTNDIKIWRNKAKVTTGLGVHYFLSV